MAFLFQLLLQALDMVDKLPSYLFPIPATYIGLAGFLCPEKILKKIWQYGKYMFILSTQLNNYNTMKILQHGLFDAGDGKDYFTIVIDKQRKEIFALKNFSCRAVECTFLRKHFAVQDPTTRFYFVNSGTEVDVNLIPKKYSKFTILKP